MQPPPSVEITTNTNFGCDSRSKDEEQPVDSTGEKCFIACASSEAVYTATGTGASYDWTAGGGQITGQSGNEVTVEWAPAGRGPISVTVSDSLGCSTTEIRCVEIIESPDAQIALQPGSNTCVNSNLFFNDASDGSLIWKKENGTDTPFLEDFQLDDQGNIYLTGIASPRFGPVLFDSLLFQPPTTPSFLNLSAPYLLKYDPAGNLL